jgi:hypothetical protein
MLRKLLIGTATAALPIGLLVTVGAPSAQAIAVPVTFTGNISCSLTGKMTFVPPLTNGGTSPTTVTFTGKNKLCKGVGIPPTSLKQGGAKLKKSKEAYSFTLPANNCTALLGGIAPPISMTVNWLGTSPITPTVITFPQGITSSSGGHTSIIYAIPNDGVATGSFAGTAEMDLEILQTDAQLLSECSHKGIKSLTLIQPKPEPPPFAKNDNLEVGPLF